MLRLSTQIGSAIRPKKNSLFNTHKQLQQLDIKVTHPKDGFVFNSHPWDTYEYELGFYDSVARSSFHIVWNEDGQLTKELAQQIMYAMAKGRPIVLLEKPIFTPDIDPFTRETISAHLKDLFVAHLQHMEPAELNYELKNLPESVDYRLAPRELTLIHSRVKSYFRHLLEEAKVASRLSPRTA